MCTKEQIRKGIESALFDPNKKRGGGSPVDAILSEIERLANAQEAYVQPLSVEIISANVNIQRNESGIILRKYLNITIEVTAAFVHNPNEYAKSVENLKSGFNYVCVEILRGGIQIRTTNTNINRNCHLIPENISFDENTGKLLLDVVGYGDMSDYIRYNTPDIDLIRLSILDGRLVIKARR